MKIDNIQQINFKSIYTKDNHFNERERKLEKDISGKLLGRVKPGDKKSRTWNEWLVLTCLLNALRAPLIC